MIHRTLYLIVCFLFYASFSLGQATNQLIACYSFSGNAQDGFGPNHGTVVGATLTTDRFNKPNSAYFSTETLIRLTRSSLYEPNLHGICLGSTCLFSSRA